MSLKRSDINDARLSFWKMINQANQLVDYFGDFD